MSTWASKTVLVIVQDAKFAEDTAQTYGFDDWSAPECPFQSLEVGHAAPVKALMGTVPVVAVYFQSANPTAISVIPIQASANPQSLTLTSNSYTGTWSDVCANAGSVGGATIARMQAKAYYPPPVQPRRVRIVFVKLPGQTLAIPGGSVADFLNQEVFNQCVTDFSVSFNYVPIEINYDIEGGTSECLDYGTEEGALVRDGVWALEGEGPGEAEHYVFVVKHVAGGEAWGWADVGTPPDGYGQCVWMEQTLPLVGIAHEIGHNLCLEHIDELDDTTNLMNPFLYGGTKLRAGQWDIINKNTQPRQP